MNYLVLLSILMTLASCASSNGQPDSYEKLGLETDPEAAQKLMCIEENVGITRHSRAYLEKFCPEIRSQLELICFRFIRNTKDYRKACPGIDTPDKLECISVIQNGAGYADQASLEKCRTVSNRKQVYCLSGKVAVSGVPLLPEVVQACLDDNR